MEKLLDLVKDIAPTESPILLQGETGTGKELLANVKFAWSLSLLNTISIGGMRSLVMSVVQNTLLNPKLQ